MISGVSPAASTGWAATPPASAYGNKLFNAPNYFKKNEINKFTGAAATGVGMAAYPV